MPRRLLHATCGVTSISNTSGTTSTLSFTGTSPSPRMTTPSPSPKPQVFDDYDSFSIDPMPTREESSYG